jgi:GntR family transcriptional repressor for pyruvate dehydrogenase complex
MPLQLSPVSKKAISEAVAEQLRLVILRGDVEVGDRLPPERELAPSFGTNRNTLREAIRSLEAQGLVTVRQGDGVRVADFRRSGELSILPDLIQVSSPEDRREILHDILLMRRKMAVEVARMAGASADDAAIRRLRDLISKQKAAKGDLLRTLTTDLELFETMVETSGSAGAQLMFHAMGRLSQTLLQRIPLLLFVHPDYLVDMPAVVEAIAAHQPDDAARVLESLFEKTDKVLVDRIASLP